jgi:hypothetical protein
MKKPQNFVPGRRSALVCKSLETLLSGQVSLLNFPNVFAQRWLRAPMATAHAVGAQCLNSRTTAERPVLSLTNCPTAFRVMDDKACNCNHSDVYVSDRLYLCLCVRFDEWFLSWSSWNTGQLDSVKNSPLPRPEAFQAHWNP